MMCMSVCGGVIPEPQSLEYGPVIRVRKERIRITAPEVPAAKLALEFLGLTGEAKEPELEIILKCGTADSENYRISYSSKVITVDGEGAAGMFNGVMTLLQLMKTEGDELEIKLAKVQDGPLWKQRFMGDYSPFRAANLKIAAQYKYGGLAYQYREEWHKFTAEKFREFFEPQQKYVDAGVLKFMLVYHIYATRGERGRKLFNIASEEDLKGLVERCRFAYESGFRHIMICADDWTPLENGRYVLISPEEKQKFGDSAGRGHGYLMTYLQKEVPEVKWTFCPPVYSVSHAENAPLMQQYLKELDEALPKDIPIVWTGPGVISREIAAADREKFSGYAGGHRTFIWDNSECNPYPVHRWETCLAPELAGDGIFINAKAFEASCWQTCFVASANEYLWNPAKYDKDRTYARIFQLFRPGDDVKEVYAFQKLFDKLDKMSPQDDFQKDLAELKARDQQFRDKGVITRWNIYYLNSLYAKLESPRPQMEVKLISQQPVIDGKLDDPCWQNLPEQEFQTRAGKETAPGRKAYVKAAFDREALYFGFRLEIDQELADTAFSNPDHDLFNSSDLVEIFLKPGPKYAQFVLDHRGHQFNMLYKAGYLKSKNKWEGKVHKFAKYWTAEIKIPFKLLAEIDAAPPTNQASWTANFCREFNAAKELQCWSPTHANSFLNPEMFGTLIFRE